MRLTSQASSVIETSAESPLISSNINKTGCQIVLKLCVRLCHLVGSRQAIGVDIPCTSSHNVSRNLTPTRAIRESEKAGYSESGNADVIKLCQSKTPSAAELLQCGRDPGADFSRTQTPELILAMTVRVF